ncbi:hypothetical protein DFJ77DRAFT_467566 [Powellomyces hirtus]|nr:hypothetical protein DFJ77DRAFT_467566 [Powellomyces hirtus]
MIATNPSREIQDDWSGANRTVLSPSPDLSDFDDLGNDEDDDELGFLTASPLVLTIGQTEPERFHGGRPSSLSYSGSNFEAPADVGYLQNSAEGELRSVHPDESGMSPLSEHDNVTVDEHVGSWRFSGNASAMSQPHSSGGEEWDSAASRRDRPLSYSDWAQHGMMDVDEKVHSQGKSKIEAFPAEPVSHNIKPPLLRRMHSRGLLLANLNGMDSGVSCIQSPMSHPADSPSFSSEANAPAVTPLLNLTAFPASILERIASYLQETRSLASLLTLNQTWFKHAAKALYNSPPISSVEQFHLLMRTLVGDDGARRYGVYMTALHIPRAVSDEVLMGDVDVLLQLCPNVTSFTLENGVCVSNVLIQSLTDNASCLEKLNLRGCSSVTDVLIPTLVRSCRGLKFMDLSYTQASIATLGVLIAGCPDIEAVEMEACGPCFLPVTVDPMDDFMRPKLRYLNIRNSAATDRHIRNAVKHTPNLATCIMDGCSSISDEAILAIAVACGTNLHHLDISFNPALSDLALHAIAIHATNIKTLTLAGCDRITPAGVVAIASNTQAEAVVLHGCAGVLSSTAITDVAVHGGPLECMLRKHGLQVLANGLLTPAPSTLQPEQSQQLLPQPNPLPSAPEHAETSSMAATTDTAPGVHQTTQTIHTCDQQRPADPGPRIDPTEILMKFAEAIASGRWAPPGAPRPPPYDPYHPYNPNLPWHQHQPHPSQLPEWGRSASSLGGYRPFMTPPDSPPVAMSVTSLPLPKRRSTASTMSTSSLSSASSTTMAQTSPATSARKSRIPTPSRSNTFSGSGIPTPTRRATSSQLPRPMSSVGLSAISLPASANRSQPPSGMSTIPLPRSAHKRQSSLGMSTIPLPSSAIKPQAPRRVSSTSSNSSATTTASASATSPSGYKPRSFRKFNSGPGDPPPHPPPSRTPPPRPTSQTKPHSQRTPGPRTPTPAPRPPAPPPRTSTGGSSITSRLRWSHHLSKPSDMDVGWIQGGGGHNDDDSD